MSWKNNLKKNIGDWPGPSDMPKKEKDEEYSELSNFKKFLEDYITKIENAKFNEEEFYDMIVDLRNKVDNWAFRIEEKRDEGRPKTSYTLRRDF